MVKLLLFVVFLCVALKCVQGCDKKCIQEIPIHYHELRCQPVRNESDCCITRFDCPKIESDGKCHVNGNTYHLNEKLSDTDEPLCSAACYCGRGIVGGVFNCAQIECSEVFYGPKPECIYQSRFDRCCGKYECNKDKIAALSNTRCWLDNKEYVKGQRMYSDRFSCYSCICHEDFDNTTVLFSPHCQKTKCNIEVYYADRLKAGCIPIYYGKARCCPIDWRCPDPKDEVVSNQTNTHGDPDMTCKFGSLTLNVGDQLKSDKYCIECSCTMPPMVHCVKTGHC